jgi:hypothetical protein
MEEQLENHNKYNNQFYINKGCIDKSFFDDFIRSHVQKNLLKKCDKILEDYELIEYYSIGCKSDRVACYSELWFLDINMDDICKEKGVLLPIYIPDINTSSPYSLARCYYNQDYDDDNNQDKQDSDYKTIEEILKWCPKSCRSQINRILNIEY